MRLARRLRAAHSRAHPAILSARAARSARRLFLQALALNDAVISNGAASPDLARIGTPPPRPAPRARARALASTAAPNPLPGHLLFTQPIRTRTFTRRPYPVG